MNLAEFFSRGLSLVGTFNPMVMFFLFLVCFIGEVSGLFIPYLLEATWLLAGFQFIHGALSPLNLFLLIVTSTTGREAGALILFYLSASGSRLLARWDRFRKIDANSLPVKWARRLDVLSSPFAVALGRLLWLRMPLTIILGARRKLKLLLYGVAISSVIYDCVYIVLGAVVGTTAKISPAELVLYCLGAVTIIYGSFFAARRLSSALARCLHRTVQ